MHADYLCNEYGLDTISTGGTIAFAMDCYENGIIDDMDVVLENAETIIQLVTMIANREGLGKLLGEGVMRASREIGMGSEKFAIHVKGLEGPAHDPRSGKTLAIMYGMGNRGMCHIHPLEGQAYDSIKNDFGLIPYGVPDPNEVDRYAENGKGKIAKKLQDFGILPDILGICKFYVYNGLGPLELADMLSLLTGWEIDGEELLKIGGRVYDYQRRFNVREGVRKGDDNLPERVLKLPEFGKYSSIRECEIKDYSKMLEEGYKARGWNLETGAPE